MKLLMKELGMEVPDRVVLYGDNERANELSENFLHHTRAKHIGVHYHYVRERVREGELEIRHVPSKDNLADLLTKGLPRDLHSDLMFRMGVRDVRVR